MKYGFTRWMIFLVFSSSCSHGLTQSLSDQYSNQERVNNLKKMRDADEQAIQNKKDRPYNINDLVQRGYQLRCDFSGAVSSAAGSTYKSMTLQDAVSKDVLIDSSTVRIDYSPSARSYEVGKITGALVKAGSKIQNFSINDFTGAREKSTYWELDTDSNVLFIKDGSKIYKGSCSLQKFTSAR